MQALSAALVRQMLCENADIEELRELFGGEFGNRKTYTRKKIKIAISARITKKRKVEYHEDITLSTSGSYKRYF